MFFPDELPGLPPQRVVDFGIELHSGTSPISMTPHRMASVELQELRVQLQEIREWAKVVHSGQDCRISPTGYGLHGWDSPDHRERNRGYLEHSGYGCW